VSKHWQPPAENLSKVEQLRLRDGGRCWLCNEPFQFKAEPNSARAPTLEHLVAQCHDGPSTLENLVLCHRRCNQLLADKPLARKIKMREQRRRKAWELSRSTAAR
jgi:5-methylcytosine-specific restriction endonuclease McrA